MLWFRFLGRSIKISIFVARGISREFVEDSGVVR